MRSGPMGATSDKRARLTFDFFTSVIAEPD